MAFWGSKGIDDLFLFTKKGDENSDVVSVVAIGVDVSHHSKQQSLQSDGSKVLNKTGLSGVSYSFS